METGGTSTAVRNPAETMPSPMRTRALNVLAAAGGALAGLATATWLGCQSRRFEGFIPTFGLVAGGATLALSLASIPRWLLKTRARRATLAVTILWLVGASGYVWLFEPYGVPMSEMESGQVLHLVKVVGFPALILWLAALLVLLLDLRRNIAPESGAHESLVGASKITSLPGYRFAGGDGSRADCPIRVLPVNLQQQCEFALNSFSGPVDPEMREGVAGLVAELGKMYYLRARFGKEGRDFRLGSRLYLKNHVQAQEMFLPGRESFTLYFDFQAFFPAS